MTQSTDNYNSLGSNTTPNTTNTNTNTTPNTTNTNSSNSPDHNHVSLQVSDEGIAYVTLNRPDKLNALTIPMLHQMIRTAKRVNADRTIRVVIITGAQGNFSSGLDFGQAFKDPKAIAMNFINRPWRGTNIFQEGPWCWRRVGVPVIAAVEGYCFGGGLQIALAADYRFTSADSSWSVMESKWGLVPDMSGMQALKQVVGADVAKKLAMTAEVFSGQRAVELGLASEVADDPLAAAEQLAAALIDRSPDALANVKKLIDETWAAGERRTFLMERMRQLPLLMNANTKVARARAAAAKAGERLPAFKPRSRG